MLQYPTAEQVAFRLANRVASGAAIGLSD